MEDERGWRMVPAVAALGEVSWREGWGRHRVRTGGTLTAPA